MSTPGRSEVEISCRTGGKKWIVMILALILMNMGIVATTVYFAGSDRSAGVEPDYYARALNYDRVVDQRATNARLGWNARMNLVSDASGKARLAVTLLDREGAPVTDASVRAEAFASLRSGQRTNTSLAPANEQYVATVPISARGMWRVHLTATRGLDTFTSEQDVMLDGPVTTSSRDAERKRP